MPDDHDVVFVFGPRRRVSVVREDARYLADSWFIAEASLAGMKLRGDVKRALETGDDIRVTEAMREVLLGVLDAVAADGHLDTDGLAALREEARTPVNYHP